MDMFDASLCQNSFATFSLLMALTLVLHLQQSLQHVYISNIVVIFLYIRPIVEVKVIASDNDYDNVQILKQHVELQASLFSTFSIIYKYYMTYYDKNPPRTYVLSGYAWVLETLNTPGERIFRMNERIFIQLHALLDTNYGLKSSIHMSYLEPLAIFLCICDQNRSNILVQNTFKHSCETISRNFDDVLSCLTKMAKEKLHDRNFTNVHKRIKGDQGMWLHCKGCIGAIDDTHIGAIPHPLDYVRFISKIQYSNSKYDGLG
jgi:hypothetical protein